MRTLLRTLLLSLLLTLTAPTRPAEACSVMPTYIAPSNVELVAASPRIVIARATQAVGSEVELEVTHVLRGTGIAPGDVITVSGTTTRYAAPSPSFDFSKARPGAYAGGCTAHDYGLGKSYVLLMDAFRGSWRVRGEAFTRVNEEVEDENAPWAIAVREYVRIAKLPTVAARRKALEALVARGAAKNAPPVAQAIAGDVQAHFAAATPWKSFAELEALEKAGTANHARALMAIGVGGDPAARAYMRKEVAALVASSGTLGRLALEAIGAYYEKVSDPPVLGQLGEYYASLGKAAKDQRWPLMWLLIRRADASNRKVMEQALLGADDEEAGRLGQWFVKVRSPVAEKELLRRIGTSPGGSGAPHRSEMTLALAGMGNKAVLAWAQQLLAGTATPNTDDRWVALYAIARSPLPDADALAQAIIQRGDDDLVSLVQGYEEAQHANADRRLAEIAKLPNVTPAVRDWTERSIEARKQRP
jgi:hypothetical protein